MQRWSSLLVTALVASIAAACERGTPIGAPQPSPAAAGSAGAGSAVVARYGGETLTADELAGELQRLPDRSRRTMNADARRKFVDNYMLNELLYQEGERQGLAQDPEILRQVDDLKKRLVVQRVVREVQNLPPVTDEEVRAFYDANPEKFSTTTIKARHILVKDEATARQVREQVLADPDKFAEIAQQTSIDTASARKGGDLGTFGRGRMVPEFETAAFALQPGQISEVVKTPYGYHVIRVEEVRPGAQKPFEQVKEQIRATLRSQALQTRTQAYYDKLRTAADIQIDEAAIEEVAARVTPPDAAGTANLPAGHPAVRREAIHGADVAPHGPAPIAGAPPGGGAAASAAHGAAAATPQPLYPPEPPVIDDD